MSVMRADRIGDQMKRELGDILQRELKDPRIPPFTGVSEVKVTRDLSHATCYISVLGTTEQQADCLEALRKAAGYMRREIAQRIRMRITPELHFILDDSVREGLRMSKLIDEALAKDALQRAPQEVEDTSSSEE